MCNNIEILKLVSELAEKESDRFWTRYSTMLYATTVLVGIVSFSPSNYIIYILLLCSILGCVISFVWLIMVKWGLYYQDRWIFDQKKIIESNIEFKEFIKGRDEDFSRSSNARLSKPYGLDPRLLYKILPVSFFIIWVSLGSFSIYVIF